MQGLKARSLLEDIGDGVNGVSVHDLYLDFAKLEAKRGPVDARRWVWYERKAAYPSDLLRRPPGNCWPNVERVKSVERMETIKGITWQNFANIVVLELLISRNEVLDLRGLQSLRSLYLEWARYGEPKGGAVLIGVGELRNLGWLELSGIHYAACLEEIGRLTTLQVLRLMRTCQYTCSQPLELPNVDKCIHLRELVLDCHCLKAFPDLSKMTSLRKVIFNGCHRARD